MGKKEEDLTRDRFNYGDGELSYVDDDGKLVRIGSDKDDDPKEPPDKK